MMVRALLTPLYKRYSAEIDPTVLNVDNMPEDTYELDEINQHSSNTEWLLVQQYTLLWDTRDMWLVKSP
jgi:hypothetical protein